MNKTLQNTSIVGIVVVSFSLLWALVWVPYAKDRDFKACLKTSEETLAHKQSEIRGHIGDLEKQKEIAQKEADAKLEMFLKENPEPEKQEISSGEHRFAGSLTGKHWQWEKEKYAIFDAVRRVEDRIKSSESDFEKVEKEKGESDEVCFKKFR